MRPHVYALAAVVLLLGTVVPARSADFLSEDDNTALWCPGETGVYVSNDNRRGWVDCVFEQDGTHYAVEAEWVGKWEAIGQAVWYALMLEGETGDDYRPVILLYDKQDGKTEPWLAEMRRTLGVLHADVAVWVQPVDALGPIGEHTVARQQSGSGSWLKSLHIKACSGDSSTMLNYEGENVWVSPNCTLEAEALRVH